MTPTSRETRTASPYLDAAKRFADQMIACGRDTYGREETRIFINQLDAEQLTHRPWESTWLFKVWYRPGGCSWVANLQYDSGLLRLLYALSHTGQGPQYAEAADGHIADYLDKGAVTVDGVWSLAWGEHGFYDIVKDEPMHGCHEYKMTAVPWEDFYRLRPEATVNLATVFRHHITQFGEGGQFNRHWPAEEPFSMAGSLGFWIAGWAAAYSLTGEEHFLGWIDQMLAYVRDHRGRTGLFGSPVDAPRNNTTMYCGPWTQYSAALLRAAQYLDPLPKAETLREEVHGFQRAFLRYASMDETGGHATSIELDTGEERARSRGWEDLAVRTLAGMAVGYEQLGDEALREAADKLLAGLGIAALGEARTRQTHVEAGALAHVLTALLNLHGRSGEQGYLEMADALAGYALRFHIHNDLIVLGGEEAGPPDENGIVDDPWTSYSNRRGCDDLAYLLLKLHLVRQGIPNDRYYADPLNAH
jgi:hypothetical protein